MISATEILKAYKNIDAKLQFERDIIQGSRVPSAYILSLKQEIPDNTKVQELHEQFRELEWQTLMEYKRLTEVKFICWKAMSGLSEVARGVLIDRAVCGMPLTVVAHKYRYSESQVKRIFKQAYAAFVSEVNALY